MCLSFTRRPWQKWEKSGESCDLTMNIKGNPDFCVFTCEHLPKTKLHSLILALHECISIYDPRFLKITWAPNSSMRVEVVIYSKEAPYAVDLYPCPQLATRGRHSQRERCDELLGRCRPSWDGASCASASACPAEPRSAGSSAPGPRTALGGGARAPPGGTAGAGSAWGAPGELQIRGGCGETKCTVLTWSHSLSGNCSGSMQDSYESNLLLVRATLMLSEGSKHVHYKGFKS